MTGAISVQGDARKLPIRDSSVALSIWSPPYALGVDYVHGDVPMMEWQRFIADVSRELYRVTIPGGRMALNVPLDTAKGGFRSTYVDAVNAVRESTHRASGDPLWRYRSTIVWNEDNTSKSVARGSIDSASSPYIYARVEMIPLFSKPGPKAEKFGPWWRGKQGVDSIDHQDWLDWTNGMWAFRGESRSWEKHPAAFPEELPKRLVHLLTFRDEIVLDCTGGSGTTAKVAKSLGRIGVSVDVSNEYALSAGRRLETVSYGQDLRDRIDAPLRRAV